MANEVVNANAGSTLSTALTTELESVSAALPPGFNIQRFVSNSIALLNGNTTLAKFAKDYGTAQIKQHLITAAYLGLDAMNDEMYLIPYNGKLDLMSSYKGMIKLASRNSVRPIKSIYAKIVREGDVFEENIIDGEPSISFRPVPFNNDGNIIGAFAVCKYQDGGILYETMSKAEIEACRSKSMAKNSGPWRDFWCEMAKKTVLKRLCKNIPQDMDVRAMTFFNSGTEIETDPVEIVKKEISEGENKEAFSIDDESGDDFE